MNGQSDPALQLMTELFTAVPMRWLVTYRDGTFRMDSRPGDAASTVAVEDGGVTMTSGRSRFQFNPRGEGHVVVFGDSEKAERPRGVVRLRWDGAKIAIKCAMRGESDDDRAVFERLCVRFKTEADESRAIEHPPVEAE